MMQATGFETRRLRLRQWRDADLEPFAALNADPRVMQFFRAPLDRAKSDGMAKYCEARIAERGWGLWAAELKDSGCFIGFVGLDVPLTKFPFSPCVEVGWRLAYEHWGNGYATEAAKAALNAAFAQLALAEVVSFTSVANARSRAVMERIGMRDSQANFEHPNIPAGNSLREHCLYRITREQWRGIAG